MSLIELSWTAKNLKGWFLGVFLCAFMSLAYGTVMYVWMMEHCDGESENFLSKDSHPPCKKKLWSSHVCLDDGTLRWWVLPLEFLFSTFSISRSGKIKTVLGACPHYNFGFWGLMTALIAYLVPDWRDMQVSDFFTHFSCHIFLIFPLFPISWSSPCHWCYCTARTGFSRSRRDGCSLTGESRRPRTLSERLQGGVGWGGVKISSIIGHLRSKRSRLVM